MPRRCWRILTTRTRQPERRIKSYAEVANLISMQLFQNGVNAKADRIMLDAKKLTEAGLEKLNQDITKLSAEEYKKLAGDYKAAAEELSGKYKIKVYAGETGLLSPADMRRTSILASCTLWV